MHEHEVIALLKSRAPAHPSVQVGIGDDGAVTTLPRDDQDPADARLVTVTDSLVEGTHFPADYSPECIAHRSLATNLSDLAAMGAQPLWFTLSLSLPAAESTWLEQFADGLFALANQVGVTLVGGDTVRGPLAVTITALGRPAGKHPVLRSGAETGDLIFVTGELGAAGYVWQAHAELVTPAKEDAPDAHDSLRRAFDFPQPRIKAGTALAPLASAMIDISDGLQPDLSRMLAASGRGAECQLADLPCAHALVRHVGLERARELALTGGDDYELCFTLPPERRDQLKVTAADWCHNLTCIGAVTDGDQLRWVDATDPSPQAETFSHFGSSAT